MKLKKKDLLYFFGAIIICQLTGLVGAVYTMPAISTWYAGLNRPSFAPPNWIFGPVWTILFLLMGVSLFLVTRKKKRPKEAVEVFFLQLVLNVLWSVLFFGLESPFLAFLEIFALWFAIDLSIYYFYKVSRPAAWLLVPYIIWVSFAAFLNYFFWIIN